MESYIGKICPLCKTEIKEGDSAKVCPDCGTAHHEHCWTENNGCINGCGTQNSENTANAYVCKNCGEKLGDDQAFCHKCGTAKVVETTETANICQNCGEELSDGQEFCHKCGTKVQTMAIEPSVIDDVIVPDKKARTKSSKKVGKSVIIGIAIGIVIIAAAVGLFFIIRGTPVESIAFEKETGVAFIGEPTSFEYKILPEDATNKKVKLESSDPQIATIDENGNVVGVGNGKCTITISSNNKKTDTIEINVGPAVEKLTMQQTTLELHKGDSKRLLCVVEPKDAIEKDVTWTSSDEKVAKVTNVGRVTAVSSGTCIITAKSHNGLTTTCKVTVKKGINFAEKYLSYSYSLWCEIASDGTWMKIDTNPLDIDSDLVYIYSDILLAAYNAIEKVNKDLGFSSALIKRMDETYALQGVQTEQNSDYIVTWSYHPDKGLEVMYRIND